MTIITIVLMGLMRVGDSEDGHAPVALPLMMVVSPLLVLTIARVGTSLGALWSTRDVLSRSRRTAAVAVVAVVAIVAIVAVVVVVVAVIVVISNGSRSR